MFNSASALMKLTDMLKQKEGFRPKLYKDFQGRSNIGYGFNLEDGISEQMGEYLLLYQIGELVDKCLSLPFITKLSDVRKVVIINMAHDIGVAGVLKFTDMIEAIEKEEYKKAADAMLDSLWRHQVGHRAVELAMMMEDGEWSPK